MRVPMEGCLRTIARVHDNYACNRIYENELAIHAIECGSTLGSLRNPNVQSIVG